MGSIGDGDDEIQPVKLNSSMDDCENETQPFDSEKLKDQDFDEFQFQRCTLPMDDTVPLEDAFETQAINLAGETEVLDDPNGLVNVGARLLGDCDYGVVDSDGEGSDKTEVLDDSAELSDDDFTKRVGSCLVDQENKLCSSISKQEIGGFEAELDGLDIEVQSAGSEQKNFTSVHAASLRACSVAVRSMAFKGNSDEPSPVKSDIQSSKQHTSEVKEIACIRNSSVLGVEVELEDLSGERNEQIKGSGTVNKCRIGTTVGRLFLDDALGEIEGPDNSTDNAVLPHLPACGDEAAGLSYVDSQEPGELSQDNALNFVDRFLKFNVMDFDQEGDIGRSSEGKSKPISITKGTQSLAKITNLISTAGERGSFDWDDSREDEGGGEFFAKKKEALFDDGGGRRKRSCTKYQKLKNYSKGWGAVDETSDKGIVLQNSKRNDKKVNIIETKSKMNVIKELKEHLENVVPGGIDATGTDKDMPEMLNVGLDTQMAAEAMEALCFGLDVANCDNKDTNDGTKNISEGSCRGEKWNRAWSKTYARRKRSSSVKDCHLQGKAGTFTPIACQTRQQSVTNPFRAGIASYDSGKASTLNSKQSGELETVTEQVQSYQKLSDAAVGIGEFRRTRRKLSGQLNGSSNPNGVVNQIVEQENSRQSREESNRPKTNALKRKNRASKYDGPVLSAVDKGVSGCAAFECCSDDGIVYPKDMVGALASKLSDRQSDADTISAGGNTKLEVLPVDKCKSSGSVSGTPINCITPVSAASPICEGDLKQSSRKNLSRSFLVREINSLFSNRSEGTSMIRDSRRRRREMANVRVLFSHHLNGDIIKQQKKILARLGASVASSISETTHFVTDEFVRTRNMLEAIAFGKPVVTHLWLESCGQAGCFIDERTYILRDAKKEKEFGFSLPLSLARASRCPLLQGQKVLITPNTKPGKELLVGLVKAVHGQALERIGTSAFKAGEIPDGLLVLSCEEDYATCAPFLEKGAAVYSSELLLNGIVTQKLEYERHRLFVDRIKKTRSRKQRSLSACD